jgi:hypothetical protein
MRTRTLAMAPAVAALAIGAAACGSSGNQSDTSASTSSSSSAASKPIADISSLSGRSTAVKLDPGFVAALKSLKVTPGVLGSAKLTDGSLVFPITGGNVKYYKPGSVSPYVQGRIDHSGSGLSLTAGGKKVALSNFVVDPGASMLTGKVAVNGKVAAPSAPLFSLDGRTLQPLKTNSDGTAVLQGTTVKLTPTAAQLLDKTYGITAIKPGLEIGVAKITVNTK